MLSLNFQRHILRQRNLLSSSPVPKLLSTAAGIQALSARSWPCYAGGSWHAPGPLPLSQNRFYAISQQETMVVRTFNDVLIVHNRGNKIKKRIEDLSRTVRPQLKKAAKADETLI